FFENVKLGQAEFFERWRLIGGPPREAQTVFPIELSKAGQLDLVRYREVIGGQRIGILEDIDTNPNNIFAAGVLHTAVEGKLCRLTIRSTSEDVAKE
ncbi:hypothetical protein MPER_15861, partial [Moniliophthora perniciosa FA553]